MMNQSNMENSFFKTESKASRSGSRNRFFTQNKQSAQRSVSRDKDFSKLIASKPV